MIEPDTVRLLRECDAGIKMGVSSIEDVVEHIHAEPFRQRLVTCKKEHEKLDKELQGLLDTVGDDGKDPNPMAKGMSWVKTNFKMAMDHSDSTIAGLMTDGCNMGVKSLNQYLNKYQAASEESKDLTKRLINLEEDLAVDIRQYL